MGFRIDPRLLLAEHHRRTVNAVSGLKISEELRVDAEGQLAEVAGLIEVLLSEDLSDVTSLFVRDGIDALDERRLSLGIVHDLTGELEHV